MAEQMDAAQAPKLQISKIVEGDIMCLRFSGTIDEDFNGKQLADTVKGILILDLGQVRRISSFGIREWVSFVAAAGEKCKDIYYIEASPKIIDQFNMVANFGGKGKILSFYAPYRCDYCDDDRQRLVQVEDAWDDIQNMHLPDFPCESCGNPEYFDEDPQSFFLYLSNQPKVEPDPAVSNFLANKLNYRVSDAARRLRIDKHVGDATYIKLAGDIDASFPVEKIIEGLEGDVVLDVGSVGRIDDEGAAAWVDMIQHIAPVTGRILIRRATPGFIERLATGDALAGKVEVLDFYMPFSCASCGTTAAQLVSVPEHFDLLKFATPPEMTCEDCGGKTDCVASESFLGTVAALPKPEVGSALGKFIEEAEEVVNRPVPVAGQAQAGPQLPGGGVPVAQAPAQTVGLAVLLAVVASVVVVAGLAFGVWKFLQIRKTTVYDEAGKVVEQKTKKAPVWLDKAKKTKVWREGNMVQVVGFSHSARDNEEARRKAVDDALERLVQEIAVGISDENWKAAVLGQYKAPRTEAIEAFQRAVAAKDADAVRKARKHLWASRHRVAQAFQRTADDVPTDGEDFWQKLKTSDGTRWRYWILITVDETKLEQYRRHYTKSFSVQGVKAANYFPGLAWLYRGVTGGAVILDVTADSPWRVPGLERGNIVVDCRRQQIESGKDFVDVVTDLTNTLKKTGGRVECRVLSGDVTRAVGYEIAKPRAPRRGGGGGHRSRGWRPTTFPGNVWDDPTK